MSGYYKPLTPGQIEAVEDKNIDFSDIRNWTRPSGSARNSSNPISPSRSPCASSAPCSPTSRPGKGLPDPDESCARKLRARAARGQIVMRQSARQVTQEAAKLRSGSSTPCENKDSSFRRGYQFLPMPGTRISLEELGLEQSNTNWSNVVPAWNGMGAGCCRISRREEESEDGIADDLTAATAVLQDEKCRLAIAVMSRCPGLSPADIS